MLRGILLKIAATLAFATMSATIKLVSSRFPVGEIVLFRSVFAMATLVAWLVRRGEFPRALGTRRKLGHVGRSIAGSGGMFFGFIALSLLPLADATAFTFVSPLLIVPMAALGLHELVRPYRWAAVGVGFVGVLVMLSDDLGQSAGATAGYSAGATIALCGALCTAVAMIQTRRLSRSEATGAIVFYFTLFATMFTALPLVLSISTTAPWSFTSLRATSNRCGMAVRKRATTGTISRPRTLSCGPVKPASVRYAVPPGKICSSAVCTCVCVPTTPLTRPSSIRAKAIFSEVASA